MPSYIDGQSIHLDACVDDSWYLRRMLVEALRAKGWSYRDAGREILIRWRNLERRSWYPRFDAIAGKIGLLAGGNATWWLKRPKALEALADLLHCKSDDLLPRGAKRRPTQIEFADFAEMAGLLPAQAPCAVNPEGWLGDYVEAALHKKGRWWFTVPAGCGKSLAVRVLRERVGADAVVTTARTLFDAARQAKIDEALVAEVAGDDPAGDAAAIAELSRRAAPTCILAAFGDGGSLSTGGWQVCSYVLHSNWREQLVDWLRTRVPAPVRIDTDAILTWLETVDPTGGVFSTPGDLVSIVARIYRSGIPERSVGLDGLAREWLSQTLGRDSDAWLRRFGREATEHLVGERVRRLDLALEPLSTSSWAGLLPERLLRPHVDRSPSSKVRKTKRDIGGDPDPAPVNARDAVHTLVDKGVLRSSRSGGLDVFPNWVRVGLERDAIQREVRSGDPTRWGLWANDVSRKESVDDALDAMGPGELVRAASKISGEEDLASVAAAETMFSAFGRRFATSVWRPVGEAIPVLQSLGLRQLRLLDRHTTYNAISPRIAITRQPHDFDSRRETDWWTEAWTFSLAVPPPQATEPDPGWKLPGWAPDLRLRNAPHLGHLMGRSSDERRDDTRWVLRVLRSVRGAVRCCHDPEPPDDVDLCLLAWVVIDGPARGWRIGKLLARSLLGSRLLDYVTDLLRRESEEVCVAAVAEVWRALRQLDAYANPLYALRALRDGHRTFFDLLTTHLPEEPFTGSFDGVDLRHTADELMRLLLDLPDRLSRVAIRLIADQARAGNRPIWNLDATIVRSLGYEQIDVLVDLAATRFAIGVAAAERVWLLDHRRSLDEAIEALRTGSPSASTWFQAAPPQHVASLLDAVQETSVCPEWVRGWLAIMLSRAGGHAPRVFEMMTQRRQG